LLQSPSVEIGSEDSAQKRCRAARKLHTRPKAVQTGMQLNLDSLRQLPEQGDYYQPSAQGLGQLPRKGILSSFGTFREVWQPARAAPTTAAPAEAASISAS